MTSSQRNPNDLNSEAKEGIFSAVDQVVRDTEKFNKHLGNRIDAYTIGKMMDRLSSILDTINDWKVIGSAVTGSTAFAKLGILGLTVMPATPMGWVVLAGVVASGTYYGVQKLSANTDNDTDKSSNNANTPLDEDVLGVALCSLIMPLALKVSAVDGKITDEERITLKDYFVDNWGYDSIYIEKSIEMFEQNLDGYSIPKLAKGLRNFIKDSKNCDHEKIQNWLMEMLEEIAGADGDIHEKEKQLLESIREALQEDSWFDEFSGKLKKFTEKLKVNSD